MYINDLEYYKDIIYHLTDRIYTRGSLNKILEYSKCLNKAYRDNDYSSLLDFVKYKDEYLAKCYDEMKRNNEELQITSEEELIEKLFKLEYKEFNKEFFNNLVVYEMEK